MLKCKTEQLTYETETVDTVTCDVCGKDITEEEFFKVDLSFVHVGKHKKFIEKVYDVSNCTSHICKECTVRNIKGLINSIDEYIVDSL